MNSELEGNLNTLSHILLTKIASQFYKNHRIKSLAL